jgi:DNA-binding transcriptional LysR family regulator
LNRTTRSVSLTDAGMKLLERVRPAISELGAAVEELNEFRDTPAGVLRLSVSNVAAEIVLAPVIKSFLLAYPAISLDITIDDTDCDIVSGRFDAGMRVGRLVTKDMQMMRVTEPSRTIAIASPEYLQHRTAPKAPPDLQRHNCITHRRGQDVKLWEFAKGKSKFEIVPTGSLTVSSVGRGGRRLHHRVLRRPPPGRRTAGAIAGRLVSGTSQLLPVLLRAAATAGTPESIHCIPAAAARAIRFRRLECGASSLTFERAEHWMAYGCMLCMRISMPARLYGGWLES